MCWTSSSTSVPDSDASASLVVGLPFVVSVITTVGVVMPMAVARVLFRSWLPPAPFCRMALIFVAKSDAMSSIWAMLLLTIGSGLDRMPASALPPLEPSRLRMKPTINCSADRMLCRLRCLKRSSTPLKSGPWNWNCGVGRGLDREEADVRGDGQVLHEQVECSAQLDVVEREAAGTRAVRLARGRVVAEHCDGAVWRALVVALVEVLRHVDGQGVDDARLAVEGDAVAGALARCQPRGAGVVARPAGKDVRHRVAVVHRVAGVVRAERRVVEGGVDRALECRD